MTRRPLPSLLCSLLLWAMGLTDAHSRDYYVSPMGSDSNPGTQAQPWRSIAKVNDTAFRPGDHLYFQGGGSFIGTIKLDQGDSGTSDEKLVVTSYGGDFDLDGGMTNSILQYNLSYNNDGPGYFLCQFPGAPAFKDSVVRYNISQNDGAKNNRRSGIDIYSASPNASSCQVYNNTIYTQHGAAVGFGGLPMPDVVFRNNIFICSGDVISGETRRGRFENNVYWPADGRSLSFDGHPTLREWAEATGQEKIGGEIVGRATDPRLAGPVGGAWAHADNWGAGKQEQHGLKPILQAYGLTPDSPCIGAGIIIKDNGGRDFWGHRVPESERPAVGACEKP